MDDMSNEEYQMAENLNSMTIKGLFSGSNNLRIPPYQRAYSWEQKQWGQFLDDLQEQNGKQYYLGQLLFERSGNTINLIDGQQRLTTAVIFISALAKNLKAKGAETSSLHEMYLSEKFKTIEDDQIIFKRVVQKNLASSADSTETLSQRRLIGAFLFFEDQLGRMDVESLGRLLATLENAVVSPFYIKSKVEAAQVFEYQNNRGRDLTRLEIIKAYLMHQVYLQGESPEQANADIAEIQSCVSLAYRHIEATEGVFSENELLEYCCILFYGKSGNVDAIKQLLSDHQGEKCAWIKQFFERFVEIAVAAKGIVSRQRHPGISNLFFVGNEANWKIVVLALFCQGRTSEDEFDRILKLLEILCFKMKLGDYRADHLHGYARKYFNNTDGYNIQCLYQDVKKAANQGFMWYWNDKAQFEGIIRNYFENGTNHYNRNIIKFVLWQYENHLRDMILTVALLDRNLYEEYTIEHISPQNPRNGPVTEEFSKNFLHIAGNLALLTQSQNSRFGNNSFEEKRELFQDTALTSYTEIRSCGKWTEEEIMRRHQNILQFVLRYFDITGL